MKNSVLFIINRRFGGTCRLHLQGRRNNASEESVTRFTTTFIKTTVRNKFFLVLDFIVHYLHLHYLSSARNRMQNPTIKCYTIANRLTTVPSAGKEMVSSKIPVFN
jgi:hypothetical protein